MELSFIIALLSFGATVGCDYTAGLHPSVWKGILEETNGNIKGQDKTINTIYIIFVWPEFAKWMPINILIPGLELDAKDQTKERGRYICSNEGRMSTSLEFIESRKSKTDDLRITFLGRFSLMYFEFKLFGKGFQFKDNNEVSAKILFKGIAWFDMVAEIRDLFTEESPSPECLLTIHDFVVKEMSKSFSSIDTWASWTPGVQQSDAEDLHSEFVDNVSEYIFKKITRTGLMRAMMRRADEGDATWLCLSGEFREKVKSDEKLWEHSSDYRKYCDVDVTVN